MSRGDGERPATLAQLLRGDCRQVLRAFPDNSFHAVVTDPPYELGFMGKGWDRSGVAYDPETWRQALRVLRPGGHALVFGGTRTFHRVACAVEDAGFELRDTVAWIFGSGFPKSKNMGLCTCGEGIESDDHKASCEVVTHMEWRGWGTALKPAFEPVIVARKPLHGTVAQNVARWGCGALNIDGCRVAGAESTRRSNTAEMGYHGGNLAASYETGSELGRWPANLAHDGSDEVLACFPSEAGAAAPVRRRNADKFRGTYGAFAGCEDEDGSTFHGDSGSAARFFYCAKATRADRDDGCEHLAPTVADSQHTIPRSEMDDPRRAGTVPRANSHPTVKPTKLMRWLVRLVAPPGGVVLDPFAGSGSTGRACALEGHDFVGVDLDAEGLYLPIAEARIRACGATVLRG